MRKFKIILVIALATISLFYSCGNNSTKKTEQQAVEVSIDEFNSVPEGISEYGYSFAISQERMNAGKHICYETEGGVILNLNGVITKFADKKDSKGNMIIGKYKNDNFELSLPIVEDGIGDGESGNGTMELIDASGKSIKKQIFFVLHLP